MELNNKFAVFYCNLHLLLWGSHNYKTVHCQHWMYCRNISTAYYVHKGALVLHPATRDVHRSKTVAWVTRCRSYHTSMRTETWSTNGQRCQGDVRNCPSLNIPPFWSTVLRRVSVHSINSYLLRNSKDVCHISRAYNLTRYFNPYPANVEYRVSS
jgi:hypothetical protein